MATAAMGLEGRLRPCRKMILRIYRHGRNSPPRMWMARSARTSQQSRPRLVRTRSGALPALERESAQSRLGKGADKNRESEEWLAPLAPLAGRGAGVRGRNSNKETFLAYGFANPVPNIIGSGLFLMLIGLGKLNLRRTGYWFHNWLAWFGRGHMRPG